MEKRNDDGRRRMPKLFCPTCGGRIIDARTKELRHMIRVVPLSDQTADYYLVCQNCRNTYGVSIMILHEKTAPAQIRA